MHRPLHTQLPPLEPAEVYATSLCAVSVADLSFYF